MKQTPTTHTGQNHRIRKLLNMLLVTVMCITLVPYALETVHAAGTFDNWLANHIGTVTLKSAEAMPTDPGSRKAYYVISGNSIPEFSNYSFTWDDDFTVKRFTDNTTKTAGEPWSNLMSTTLGGTLNATSGYLDNYRIDSVTAANGDNTRRTYLTYRYTEATIKNQTAWAGLFTKVGGYEFDAPKFWISGRSATGSPATGSIPIGNFWIVILPQLKAEAGASYWYLNDFTNPATSSVSKDSMTFNDNVYGVDTLNGNAEVTIRDIQRMAYNDVVSTSSTYSADSVSKPASITKTTTVSYADSLNRLLYNNEAGSGVSSQAETTDHVVQQAIIATTVGGTAKPGNVSDIAPGASQNVFQDKAGVQDVYGWFKDADATNNTDLTDKIKFKVIASSGDAALSGNTVSGSDGSSITIQFDVSEAAHPYVDKNGNSITNTATPVTKTFTFKTPSAINEELTIVKRANRTSGVVGDEVTYSYEVTNSGDVAITNITVSDDKLGTIGNIANLNPGATDNTLSKKYKLTASDAAAGSVVNIATAAGKGPNGNAVEATSNRVTVSVTAPASNLEIVKTADKESARVGDTVTYSIKVRNSGGVATGLTVSDTIPTGLTLVAAGTTPGYSENAGKISWQLGSLAADSVKTYTVVATVNDAAPDRVVNVATLTDADGNTKTDDAVVDTIKSALVITKDADKDSVKPGDNISYVITVKNAGNTAETDLTVTDVLDSRLTYVSSDPAATVTDGNKLTWNLAQLAVNDATATFRVVATVKDTATGVIENTALVTDPTDPQNQIPSDPVKTPVRKVTITKAADKQAVKIGDEITYTITVSNTGNTAVTDYVVSDELSSMLDLVAAKTTVGYNLNGRTVSWSTNLAAGASARFTLVAKVNDTAAGTIRNIATVTDPNDPNNPTPSDPVDTPVKSVSIEKSVDKTSAKVGDSVTYTLTVKNTGETNYTGLVISDVIPATLQVTGSQPAATVDAQDPQKLSWIIDLRRGETKAVTVTTTIRNNASGVITNTALLTDPGDPDNPIPSNPVNTIVSDISIIKAVDKTQVKLNGQLTYTIVVTNNGDKDETDLTVSDTLPDGLTFVSASEGYTRSGMTLTWPIETLEQGRSVTYKITAQATKVATLRNTATVTDPTDPTKTIPSNEVVTVVIDPAPPIQPEHNVTITKSVDAGWAKVGDTFNYTIVVRNKGELTETNLTVTDAIPAMLTIIDAGTGKVSGNKVSWKIDSLSANSGMRSFTVKVKVNRGASGTLTNIAYVTDPTDPGDKIPSNPVDTKIVAPSTKLALYKAASVTVAAVGDQYTYVLMAVNNSSTAVEELTLSDTLPAGLEIVSADGGKVNGRTITWTIDKLDGGQEMIFAVKVKVQNGAAGATLRNVAVMNDPGDPDKPIYSNEVVTIITKPGGGIIIPDDPVPGAHIPNDPIPAAAIPETGDSGADIPALLTLMLIMALPMLFSSTALVIRRKRR